MRPRDTIAFAGLLFILGSVQPADAGGWSAFVAWLSKLDPGRSFGLGVEYEVYCKRRALSAESSKGDPDRGIRFDPCYVPAQPKDVTFKVVAAFAAGGQDDEFAKASIFIMGFAVEQRLLRKGRFKFDYGGTGGVYVVGGIPGIDGQGTTAVTGFVTLRLSSVLWQFTGPRGSPGPDVGLRYEIGFTLPGFDAGVFGPKQETSGVERIWSLNGFVRY